MEDQKLHHIIDHLVGILHLQNIETEKGLNQELESKPEDNSLSTLKSNLLKIFQKYSKYSKDQKIYNNDDHLLSEHIQSQLVESFKLCKFSDNFLFKHNDSLWQKLFSHHELDISSFYYAMAIQIIITLSNLSIVNKQSLAKFIPIGSKYRILIHSKEDSHCKNSLVKLKLSQLYATILSANCTSQDLQLLYTNLDQNPHLFHVLESLTTQLSDPSLCSYILFENSYKSRTLSSDVNQNDSQDKSQFNYTFQFDIEFNNVKLNKLLSIHGNDLLLQIIDTHLTVSTLNRPDLSFGLYEFRPSILYSITIVFENNIVGLFVNGLLISKLDLLSDLDPSTYELPSQIEIYRLMSSTSSCKLFRFRVWSKSLSQSAINFIHLLGPMFVLTYDTYCEVLYDKNNSLFISKILAKAKIPMAYLVDQANDKCSTNKKTNLDPLYLDLTQSLHKKNMLVDINPNDINMDIYNYFDHYEKSNDNGRCFHYRSANLISSFTSIDCLSRTINLLSNVSTMDDLFDYVSHLLALLENSDLYSTFHNEFGFSFLSDMLYMKIRSDIKKPLSIQFFNLFLRYCGWQFDDIEKSIVRDEAAYENCILNLDLWYYVDSEKANNREKFNNSAELEVMRFLFFQVSSLLDYSIYADHNAQFFQKTNTLRILCQQYQLISANFLPSNNFLHKLNNEFIILLSSLLNANFDKPRLDRILQYGFYLIRKNDFELSENILKATNQFFSKSLENSNEEALFAFANSSSVTILMMIFEQISELRAPPITCLDIFCKILLLNKSVYKTFERNEGLPLLSMLLTKVRPIYYNDIIWLLFTTSLGNYHLSSSYFQNSDFQCFESTTECKIEMEKILYLAIDFIGWIILNNKQESTDPFKLNDLVMNFISELSTLYKNPLNKSIYDPRSSSLLTSLSDMLISLKQLSDPSSCESSSSAIIELCSLNVLDALLHFRKADFTTYMSALFHNGESSKKYSPKITDKKGNSQQLSFITWIFPKLLQDIFDLGNNFVTMLTINSDILQNLIYLFQKLRHKMLSTIFSGEVYWLSYQCALLTTNAYLMTGSRHYRFSCRVHLVELFRQNLVMFLQYSFHTKSGWDEGQRERFCKSLISNQELLFDTKYGICDSSTVCLLILFLGFQLKNVGYNDTALDCIRVIVSLRQKKMKDVMNRFCIKDKKATMKGILKILVLDNKEAKKCLETECSEIFKDSYEEQFSMYTKKFLYASPALVRTSLDQFIEDVLLNRKEKRELDCEYKKKLRSLFKMGNSSYGSNLLRKHSRYFSNFKSDKEEDANINNIKLRSALFQLNYKLEIESKIPITCKWVLDVTEDFSRMKRRLLPSHESGSEDVCSLEIKDPLPIAPPLSRDSSVQDEYSGSMLSKSDEKSVPMENWTSTEKLDENRKVVKLLRGQDKILDIWNCNLIIGLSIQEGILVYAQKHLYFVSDYFYSTSENKVIPLSKIPDEWRDSDVGLITGNDTNLRRALTKHDALWWKLSDIAFVIRRPFLLRDVAIELLFKERTSTFFSFANKKLRDHAFHILISLPKAPLNDAVYSSVLKEINIKGGGIAIKNDLAKAKLSSKFPITFFNVAGSLDGFSLGEQWVRGEISNFYYLMMVNTLAGRSFNDLTQYPVFPWVIADYDSEELDLTNPKSFRDLSKPMGAQSEKRRQQFIERYAALDSLADPNSPPFNYGTHYSSAMIVSSFLIRLKPFADSFCLLQGGSFGPPDRLFSSIQRAWCSASIENTTDVRELIPEFFFLPEFLLNINQYNFGTDQNNNVINDVKLPLWAKNDPKIFVDKNREALESPYVSAHLHEWIDLVFGFKQRGQNAVEAVNVFNKLSYSGAVNLESIKNEVERRAVTGIIYNFGQTPLQIFQEAHPAKQHGTENKYFLSNIWQSTSEKPVYEEQHFSGSNSHRSVKYIARYMTGFASLQWKGFRFPDLYILTEYTLTPMTIISNNSFQLEGKIFENVHHNDITAFAIWGYGEFVTGDSSGTVNVWEYKFTNEESTRRSTLLVRRKIRNLTLQKALLGHLCKISDIKPYQDCNMLFTMDMSGNVYSWDMIYFEMIRCIATNAKQLAVSQHRGSVAVLDQTNGLTIYNLNGLKYLFKEFPQNKTPSQLEFFDFTVLRKIKPEHAYWQEKELLVVGFEDGTLEIFFLAIDIHKGWMLNSLKKLSTGHRSAITCLKTYAWTQSLDDGHKHKTEAIRPELVVGNADGQIYLWRWLNEPGGTRRRSATA